ncbi:MAG: protein translocase subunit SecF [Dehalococcoidia bacterium]|nr:protein translocase subunit SecF [Dehalococcoidia bacterium]
MFDFSAKRRWFLLIALVIMIVGAILAFTPGGLRLGWDFKGGFQVMLEPHEGTTREAVASKLDELGYGGFSGRIQETGGNYLIRMGDLSEDEQDALKAGLSEIGTVLEGETGYISPAIASRTTRDAAIAVSVAVAVMLVYITWAFRKIPHSFRYGTATVVALIFNMLLTFGIFSLVGRFLDWEVDPLFITAMLAVIGYSVNDSIVVLDRIRENRARGIGGDYDTMVNFSISETLVRSLNTTITTVLAVLTVYLIVGGPIRSFLLALLVGILAGAYSSIFVAGELLVMWEHGDWIRLIPFASRLQRSKA